MFLVHFFSGLDTGASSIQSLPLVKLSQLMNLFLPVQLSCSLAAVKRIPQCGRNKWMRFHIVSELQHSVISIPPTNYNITNTQQSIHEEFMKDIPTEAEK